MGNKLFDSMEIRQFRAFDFLKIDQLGHINLIIGKNNVGKSTLLEALYLHANIGSPLAMRTILDNRDEPYSTDYTEFEVLPLWNLFHNYPFTHSIRESIQIGRFGAPDSALTISSSWESSDDKGSGKDNDAPSFIVRYGTVRRTVALDRPFDEALRFWNLPNQMRQEEELATPCVFVMPNGFNGDGLQSLWEQIALTDEKKDVLAALNIIDPGIEDFTVISPKEEQPHCRLRLRKNSQPIPSKVLGDGINRLIGLSMALVCSKDGIMLVDEIENGIHWSVLPDVWKFIVKVARRLNVQVFATTHSNDCLRAFHFGTKGDTEVQGMAVRLEKRGNEFHAETFDEQRLAVIVKEGIEIR
ncbi:MAG: AAA family ATPase [Deltaproteobacteria bacterium]|jgi:ABC-type cobalamin/Fe3+-siderophores transport system ATPase subunit|nr:AAA family ATPase [Deltaproteobacteria bacterium]